MHIQRNFLIVMLNTTHANSYGGLAEISTRFSYIDLLCIIFMCVIGT